MESPKNTQELYYYGICVVAEKSEAKGCIAISQIELPPRTNDGKHADKCKRISRDLVGKILDVAIGSARVLNGVKLIAITSFDGAPKEVLEMKQLPGEKIAILELNNKKIYVIYDYICLLKDLTD